MKKIISLCIAIVAIAFTANISAQTVETGSVVTYQTNGTNADSYNWTISGGAGTSSTNSITVTWGSVVGSGSVAVYATSSNNCNGPTQTLNVTIVNTLPVTLAMGAMSAICPLTTNQTDGGDPAFVATITGAADGQSVTVSYSVDGGTTWNNASGSAISGGTSNISLNANLENNTGLDASETVTIRNWTIEGVTYTPATNLTGSVTVYPAPTVTAPVAMP